MPGKKDEIFSNLKAKNTNVIQEDNLCLYNCLIWIFGHSE